MDDKTRKLIDGTDLLTVLAASGLRTDRVGKMYFSPWNQEESTPSLHLCVTSSGRQVWSCFGPVPDRVTRILARLSRKEKKTTGGGVLDLICAIHELDSYSKAIKWLEDLNPNACSTPAARPRPERATGESAFVIDRKENGIRSRYLTDYLVQRCISREAADEHCEQLTYHLKKNPKTSYIGIGFRNNSGGYAIRSKTYKWSTGADISTISSDGEKTASARSDTVVVFEGFLNFLSWLTIEERTLPGMDICVLNSVNNVSRALPYLRGHKTVRCMLDNDEAGRNCLRFICERIRENDRNTPVTVVDESPLYSGYNDLNDWLQAKK